VAQLSRGAVRSGCAPYTGPPREWGQPSAPAGPIPCGPGLPLAPVAPRQSQSHITTSMTTHITLLAQSAWSARRSGKRAFTGHPVASAALSRLFTTPIIFLKISLCN